MQTGTRVGAYEIQSALGAGGMGEVYRARDTKLRRDVALKILPPLFAANPERRARFTREAHVLASLNHPDIGAIYGVEETESVTALVLELIEGPTLAERIEASEGAGLPTAEALRIAAHIADALDAAHEKGIVHRDLKPANIKVTDDGHVKVLDFGLAKALVDETSHDAAMSPTMTAMASRLGVIVGTAAYMSPEQAKGKSVDRRADIWAFGAVLYEMLTGRRAFAGEDVTDVVVSVMTKEPDWTALPADTPPRVREVLRRCLAKDARERWTSIRDVNFLLQSAHQGGEDAPAPAIRSRTRRIWVERAGWSILVTALAGLAVVTLIRRPVAERVPMRFQFGPPAADWSEFALSPDGRTLAFVSGSPGAQYLTTSEVGSSKAETLRGTESAATPFWSPDGQQIAFFSAGKLRRVPASGGPVQTICDTPGRSPSEHRGVSWSANGTILFAGANGPLYRVSARGGVPLPATRLDAAAQQTAHRWPSFLPDGRRFLFVATGADPGHRGLYLGQLDSDEVRRVLPIVGNAVYASGHLLYVRDGTLIAHPFDASTATAAGEPVAIAEGVQDNPNASGAEFSVSSTGVIAYFRSGRDKSVLTWFDRAGHVLSAIGEPAVNIHPWFSPDQRRIALERGDPETGLHNIWMFDLLRGLATPLVREPAGSHFPVLSPDGSQVIFSSPREGPWDLFRAAVNGGQSEMVLKSPADKEATDWSPDGKVVIYETTGTAATTCDIWMLAIGGDRRTVPIVATEFDDHQGQLSPDGRWLAYASNLSGRMEVYVQAFPAGAERWQVSTAGGGQPQWRRDGSEIFYLTDEGAIMVAKVHTGSTFTSDRPVHVVQTREIGRTAPSNRNHYLVTADGQRLLVVERAPTTEGVNVILNWPELLPRR